MASAVDPEQRRAEIVAAAGRVVVKHGPEGLTMRRIAAEAGCTIGLLNHWFESKNELMAAVLDAAIATATTRAAATNDESGRSLEETLSEFLPLDDQRADEQRIWLVFWALAVGRPELRERSTLRMRELRQQLIRLLQAQGSPEAADQADLLMAILDGIAVNHLADPTHWTVDRQIHSLRRAIRAVPTS